MTTAMAHQTTDAEKRRRWLLGSHGFTIVELLIVIVVIGVIASIVLVGYSGVQKQAQMTKIKADLDQISKAMDAARHIQGNVSLADITGNSTIAEPCVSQPDGKDLAKLPKTDPCWTNYIDAMKKIEQASGVGGLSTMKDPWGRPYFLDPNETDQYATQGYCERDYMQAYTYPFKSGWAGMQGTVVFLTNSNASCIGK